MDTLKHVDTANGYTSELDKISKGENNTVFVKAKLLSRQTYGEYAGEPKNGFSVEIEKDTPTSLDLDNINVFQLNTPELTDKEQCVFDKLKEHRRQNHQLGIMDNIRNMFSLNELYKDKSFRDAYLHLDAQSELTVLTAFVHWLSVNENK